MWLFYFYKYVLHYLKYSAIIMVNELNFHFNLIVKVPPWHPDTFGQTKVKKHTCTSSNNLWHIMAEKSSIEGLRVRKVVIQSLLGFCNILILLLKISKLLVVPLFLLDVGDNTYVTSSEFVSVVYYTACSRHILEISLYSFKHIFTRSRFCYLCYRGRDRGSEKLNSTTGKCQNQSLSWLSEMSPDPACSEWEENTSVYWFYFALSFFFAISILPKKQSFLNIDMNITEEFCIH